MRSTSPKENTPLVSLVDSKKRWSILHMFAIVTFVGTILLVKSTTSIENPEDSRLPSQPIVDPNVQSFETIVSPVNIEMAKVSKKPGFVADEVKDLDLNPAIKNAMYYGKPPKLTTLSRSSLSAPSRSLWGNLSKPYPTHAFWENYVLGTGIDMMNAVTSLPYITQATDYSLDLFYPYTSMATETQFQLGFDQIVGRLTVGASTEDLTGGPSISSYDDLGVTLEFDLQSGGTMKSHVVQGSPYVSYEYENARPLITSGQIARRYYVNGEEVQCNDKARKGRIFEFSLLQFDETWKVYAFPAISLRCTAQNPPFALQADDKWSGVLRVAISNNCTFGETPHHCASKDSSSNSISDLIASKDSGYSSLLDEHASAMVTGGTVDFTVTGDTAEITYDFKYKNLATSADKVLVASEPLMLSMPHHRATFSEAFAKTAVKWDAATHRSIHGLQRATIGKTWRMSEDLTTIAFAAPREIKNSNWKDAIVKAAKTDLKYELPWNYQTGTGDPYNAGKMMAKMANIAFIADTVGIPRKNMTKFLDGLADSLELWLNGTSRNSLIYDKSWGGVVSCGCRYSYPPPSCINGGPPNCPALGGDPVSNGFDFGNGAYNDHHFHYGYMIYAAAGLAHFRPEWGKKHRKSVEALIRDIASPNPKDKYFPRFRHMDWYSGHSWAGGVAMAYLNGKNQESSTEACNAWYGISLWGRAMNNTYVRDIGRVLFAIESRGARTYWQIPEESSQIYPEEFAEHHTAGIIWQNLIQYQTWFGQLEWEVQGIQTLPVTFASEDILTPKWASKAAELFESTCGGSCDTDGWITFLCMLQAVNDKSKGWDCAQKLDSGVFDGEAAGGNGNSLSNTLYWIATRP